MLYYSRDLGSRERGPESSALADGPIEAGPLGGGPQQRARMRAGGSDLPTVNRARRPQPACERSVRDPTNRQARSAEAPTRLLPRRGRCGGCVEPAPRYNSQLYAGSRPLTGPSPRFRLKRASQSLAPRKGGVREGLPRVSGTTRTVPARAVWRGELSSGKSLRPVRAEMRGELRSE